MDESQRAPIRSSRVELATSRKHRDAARRKQREADDDQGADGRHRGAWATSCATASCGQIREGDMVAAGQPFMTIVDPSSMVLNATVNQVDAERLRLGMKATIRLDAYPDVELPGTLMGIGAMAKISTFRAALRGRDSGPDEDREEDARVIPDLTGSARDRAECRRRNTMVAPRSAVFDENGESVVFVQRARRLGEEEGGPGPDQLHPRGDQVGSAKGRRHRDCSGPCKVGRRDAEISVTDMASKDQRPKTRLGKSHPRPGEDHHLDHRAAGLCGGRRLRGLPVHGHDGSGSSGGAGAPRAISW